MTRARSTYVLTVLALAAIVAVCAWFQRDSGAPSIASADVAAPAASGEHGAVAAPASGPREAATEAPSEPDSSSPRNAIESSPPEPAPGTVSGRVTEFGKSTGIANARVCLTLERADGAREVAQLVTDEDGSYQVVLAELAAWSAVERDTTRVRADASADGHIPAQNWSYAAAPANHVRNLDLALIDGDELRGRVVDASGRPVAFAQITAMRYAHLDQGATDLEIAGPRTARSDVQGRFVLGVSIDGRAGTLIVTATAETVGCARAVVQLPADARTHDIGDIALQEFGVLAGRLAGSDGRSLPGVDLEFRGVHAPDARSNRLEDLEFNGPITFSLRGTVLTQLPLDADGKSLLGFAGRSSARAHTDQLGNFRVTGLCAGSYGVRVVFGGAGGAGGKDALADSNGNTAFETSSRAIALVASGAWIHARVVDASGANVSGIDLDFAELPEAGSAAPEVAKWTTIGLDHGEVSRRCHAGARATLRAAVGDQSTGDVTVEAPHEGVVDVALTLARQREPARGRMRVKIALPEGDDCRDYAVTLRSPANHLPVASYRTFETDESGWSPPLPAGTFDVQIEVREPPGYRPRRLLPIRAGAVTIEPSSAPDIAVAAELGGRIELSVRAPRRAGFDAGSLASAKATLTDRAERATELELQYDWFNPEESAGSSTLERYVADSPLIAPGPYRLYLECPGFECIDVSVTLLGGETNYSEFELIAKPTK